MSADHIDPNSAERNNTLREVPKEIGNLIMRREKMTEAEIDAAQTMVKGFVDRDSMPAKTGVYEAEDGKKYPVKEYETAFTFSGTLRGAFDYVPKDSEAQKKIPGLEMRMMTDFTGNRVGGELTHVIVSMDNGDQVLIEKTNPDVKSAAKQQFEVRSTIMERQASGEDTHAPWQISSDMLKDVVVAPGYPLILNAPTEGADRLRFDGAVESITGLSLRPGSELGSERMKNDPNRANYRMEEFEQNMAASRAIRERVGESAVAASGLITR